jgi:hypothetical protein
VLLLKVELSHDVTNQTAPEQSCARLALDQLSAKLGLPLMPSTLHNVVFVNGDDELRARVRDLTTHSKCAHGAVTCRVFAVEHREATTIEELPATEPVSSEVVGRVYGESMLQRVPVCHAPVPHVWQTESFTASDFARFRIADAESALGNATLVARSGSVVLEICGATLAEAERIAAWVLRTPLVADIVALRIGRQGALLPCVDFLAHSLSSAAAVPGQRAVSGWLIAPPLRCEGDVSDASGKSMPGALMRALCALHPGVAWDQCLRALFVSPTLPFVRELLPAAFWDVLCTEAPLSYAVFPERMLVVGVQMTEDAVERLGEAMAIAGQLAKFCPRGDLAEVKDASKEVAADVLAAPSPSWRCFSPADLSFDEAMCAALVRLVRESPNLAVVDLSDTTGVSAAVVQALVEPSHVRAVGVADSEHVVEIEAQIKSNKLVVVNGNERYKRFDVNGAAFDLHRRFEAFRFGLVYALRAAFASEASGDDGKKARTDEKAAEAASEEAAEAARLAKEIADLRAKLEHKVAEQARHEKRLADQRDVKHSETAAPAVTAAAVQLVAVK